MEAVISASRRFFSLPEEEKLKVSGSVVSFYGLFNLLAWFCSSIFEKARASKGISPS